MIEPGARVLVVGGTGMLAGATRALAKAGGHLTLIARRPAALARETGASGVALDLADREASRAAIAALEPGHDLALLWLHDAHAWAARACENLLRADGRVVRVLGALAEDPAILRAREPDPRPGLARQHVILGWHPDPGAPEGRRWLTHGEICAGTLAALAAPGVAWLRIGTRAGR